MALKNNTWKLNQWYDQSVAGNVEYSGKQQIWFWGGSENGLFGDREPGAPSAAKARSSPKLKEKSDKTTVRYLIERIIIYLLIKLALSYKQK